MTANATIDAAYSDFRLVKTRSVAQVVLEIPLERAEEFVEKFGLPVPGREAWVAVARLVKSVAEPKAPDPDKSEKAKERYRALPEWQKAATRAVMLCYDARFRDWVTEARIWRDTSDDDADEYVAQVFRRKLGIKSRSEIARDKTAYDRFIALETEYKIAVGQMAEVRG